MHTVRFALSFLSFLGFVTHNKSAPAASALSSFLSDPSWSSHSGTPPASELGVTPEHFADASSTYFIKDSGALLIKGAVSYSRESSRSGDDKSPNHKPSEKTKLRMSLWLLLFLGAGVLSLTLSGFSRLPPAAPLNKEKEEKREKKEREKEPFIEPVAEPLGMLPRVTPPCVEPIRDEGIVASPLQRFEKVRNLLPAAVQLATAVNTPEAIGLLSSLSECFEEAPPEVFERKFLESSLTTALAALQRVHQVATKEAEFLLLKDEDLCDTLEISKWEEELKEAGPKVRQAVAPFRRTVESLQGNIKLLSKRIKETGERMRSQRKFISEEDGELLVAAAADLQQLRISIDTKKRAVRLAGHAHTCSVETVKSMMTREREVHMWDLDGQLASLCLKADLCKATLDKERAFFLLADNPSAARNARKSLDLLQTDLSALFTLAERLHLLAVDMQTAGTLKAAESINLDLSQQQQQAAELLKRGAEIAAALPAPAEQLGASGMEAAATAAAWIEKSFYADLEAFNVAMQQAKRYIGFLDGGREQGICQFGVGFGEAQRRQLATIKRAALNREEAFSSLILQLKNSKRSSEALSLIEETVDSLKGQAEDRETLETLAQTAFFLQMLQDDLVYFEGEARRTAYHKGDFEETERRQCEKLQVHLIEAARGVKEAATLEQASEAAAYVRDAAIGLQDLLLSSKAIRKFP